eukprot:TRINITY_DN8419_c0_g3_i1.p1 TRINITY_DN8419_c0_g3~~TRINITY_DN8419_c0_g3_i1.p1  ORF type:complete len:693 (+),score=120.83 TRINITY_DN8419_c0_g3_i1:71-2149(+)
MRKSLLPKMPGISIALCLLALITVVHASTVLIPTNTAPPRQASANADWKFFKGNPIDAEKPDFDDRSWTSLSLPHTWNAIDGEFHDQYYRGPGWYRKHITFPGTTSSNRIFIQFDGAFSVAELWINGEVVGWHEGGFAGFRFEITDFVSLTRDNVIAVRVNNSFNANIPPLDADFTFFGGLYRDAWILTTEDLHFAMHDYGSCGVYLTPSNVSAASADLEIRALVFNARHTKASVAVIAQVKDASGAIVESVQSQVLCDARRSCELTSRTTIPNPHLWNARADPYLYIVDLVVQDLDAGAVTDAITQPLGFRFYHVDANNGFFLNGKYLDLHGVNRHQDRINEGWAISNDNMSQDFDLITEIGATVIRLCHYQHHQFFYDLCDAGGLVVWAELPLINYITDSDAFTANSIQQLRELIRQNYNHPSVFFWSISNEILGHKGPNVNPLLARLNALVHEEDPTRLSTLASCCSAENDTANTHTDLVGFNRYFGWYGGNVSEFAPWADHVHQQNPQMRFAVSEYGAGASIHFHNVTPVMDDHTEEYQCLFHEAYWQAMQTRQFLWGKFVWNMFDFASATRNEGDTPGRNDKGLMTYDRQIRKDAFFWYKVNWNTHVSTVYITSRRFNPRTTAEVSVKVYSNQQSVQLTVNGLSWGTKTSSNRVFVWSDVRLQTGENTVVATASDGSVDKIVWQCTM